MTVLMVAAVVPSNGSKPYILMGADTKKIGYNIYTQVTTEENDFYGKVIEINKKLIGISGQFPDEFIEEYTQMVSSHEADVESLTTKSFEYIKEVVADPTFETTKIVVFIAAIENNLPIIGSIDVRKNVNERADINITRINEGIMSNFNFPSEEDLVNSFNEKIIKNNKYDKVRKYMNTCLKEAAARHPETCNQKPNIRSLGK